MEPNVKKLIGKRLQQIRKAKGLSQEKLSELIGISPNSLSRIERGLTYMSFPNIEKLMAALGADIYELFLFKGQTPQEVVYSDVAKRLDEIKNDPDKLFIISEILNRLN
jgi:transcriptional regulator with XRE-family HTH domain